MITYGNPWQSVKFLRKPKEIHGMHVYLKEIAGICRDLQGFPEIPGDPPGFSEIPGDFLGCFSVKKRLSGIEPLVLQDLRQSGYSFEREVSLAIQRAPWRSPGPRQQLTAGGPKFFQNLDIWKNRIWKNRHLDINSQNGSRKIPGEQTSSLRSLRSQRKQRTRPKK